MAEQRVLLVGDSLFAETMMQLFTQQPGILVTGISSSLSQAATWLSQYKPQAIIVAAGSNLPESALLQLLLRYPDLPILLMNLNSSEVLLIHSQRLEARSVQDILTIIASIPKSTQESSQ
ncbi:MAG: hypothetical protein ANABAC_1383 [Anaerolineae bacterium]|jgi:DNA-binding NarL/FixJ family response regulator|nr:MAG: hypothetical protein ANABAC_1383 [Anaerolineae bacterium]